MLFQIFSWILLITTFSFFGSWYVRRYDRPDALIGLYVAFVLISNILAYKVASFSLGPWTVFSDAATLVFAVTFLLTDIVNEKFGRKETQRMIFIAFITQVAVACFVWLAVSLPPAPFWSDQDSFAKIIGFTPRLMLASWCAFLIAENIDAYIFSWFKQKTNGKHLWMRNAFSTLPSMILDTCIFVVIAFYGVQPLWSLITGVLILKWMVGFINIPFMYLNRAIMYKKDSSSS